MSKFKAFFSNPWVKWPLRILIGVPVIFLVFVYFMTLFVGWGTWPWKLEPIAHANYPKFIIHNYIDLDRIYKISKFRAATGHDASDSFEDCRTMKHYFAFSQRDPDPSTITLYAPTNGKIAFIFHDAPGSQVWIRPDGHPQYLIEIFHAVLDPGLKIGSKLTSGQKIGHHVGNESQSDMLVSMRGLIKLKYLSYFEVMTDEVFAEYQALGIESRDTFIIPKEVRDRDPRPCNWDPVKTGLYKNEDHPNDAFVTIRKETIPGPGQPNDQAPSELFPDQSGQSMPQGEVIPLATPMLFQPSPEQ